MKKDKQYNFHIPKDYLPVIESLVDVNYSNRSKKTYFIRYLYVIDYILRGQYSNTDYVPVNLKILSKILGTKDSETAFILKALTNRSLINVVKKHKVSTAFEKGWSTGYSIPVHEEYSLISYLGSNPTVNKIISKRNGILESDFKDTEIGKLYYDYISNITIDYIYSINTITTIYISPIVGRLSVKYTDYQLKTLFRINEGDIFLKRPDKRSRVICNFSVLHRDLRKHMRFNGKVFKGLDIRNSQPLLAGVMIKKDYYGNNKILDIEIDGYITLCEKGLFYEEFMPEGDVDRKWFKRKFFEEVFFSRSTDRKTSLKKMFIKRFPEIFKVIEEIKGERGTDQYKNFAINLQRFESLIIFDNVNVTLLKEGRGCFNIYDSIVSHDDSTLERARDLLLEEFRKYKVTPTINLEFYD